MRTVHHVNDRRPALPDDCRPPSRRHPVEPLMTGKYAAHCLFHAPYLRLPLWIRFALRDHCRRPIMPDTPTDVPPTDEPALPRRPVTTAYCPCPTHTLNSSPSSNNVHDLVTGDRATEDHMDMIVTRQKNREFRKKRYPPTVERFWIHKMTSTSALTHICHVGLVIVRSSQTGAGHAIHRLRRKGSATPRSTLMISIPAAMTSRTPSSAVTGSRNRSRWHR